MNSQSHSVAAAVAAAFATFLCAVAPLSAHGESLRAPAAMRAAADVPGVAVLPHWSPKEVRSLIREIEQSRDAGLDPADYGLAALKGELVQTTVFLGRRTSPQMDTLADAAAMALARDYAGRDAGKPRRAKADKGPDAWLPVLSTMRQSAATGA